MATERKAEFSYQGEGDQAHVQIAEVHAIQEVTGLELRNAVENAASAARQEACSREDCRATADVSYDRVVVGTEAPAIAGLPYEEIYAPVANIELFCDQENCMSFYGFAGCLESLATVCMGAVELAESQADSIIRTGESEAGSILRPAQQEAEAILAPAKAAADAILIPATEQSVEIRSKAAQAAATERQATYDQALKALGMQTTSIS